MKAWCDQCEKYIDCTEEYSRTENLEMKGMRFNAVQSFGKCPVCGEEVLTESMADANIRRAHNAYRRALGSVTPEEIRHILDKYDIGAQPLSLLLGWGANTVERQMKHTIPDREHANRLKALNDPRKMYQLLAEGKDRISSAAYNKAMDAVAACLRSEGQASDPSGMLYPALLNLFYLEIEARKYASSGRYQKSYQTSSTASRKYVFGR